MNLEPAHPTFALGIHGGAGQWRVAEEDRVVVESELERVLSEGRELLARGATSLDTVETVVRLLEDSPWFNAGKGSTMNSDRRFELDASIMDGRDRSSGAIAGVSNVRNPISLARQVMEQSPHVFLAGEGAERFAQSVGVELVEQDYFATERQAAAWQRVQANQPTEGWNPRIDGSQPSAEKHGTVGCVALDQHGNLAAGTSTGGIVMKRFGRVGDSPIIGAGTYADNATCAVSGTGVGELFIRNAVAYDIAARVAYLGETLDAAVRSNLHERLDPDTGGVIAVDTKGNLVVDFNTQRMAYGIVDSAGRLEVKLKSRK